GRSGSTAGAEVAPRMSVLHETNEADRDDGQWSGRGCFSSVHRLRFTGRRESARSVRLEPSPARSEAAGQPADLVGADRCKVLAEQFAPPPHAMRQELASTAEAVAVQSCPDICRWTGSEGIVPQ